MITKQDKNAIRKKRHARVRTKNQRVLQHVHV